MEDQEVNFFFSSFPDKLECGKDSLLLAFGFEGQEDLAITKEFPELEARRKSIDRIRYKGYEEAITIQSISRGNKIYHAGLIYIAYPWKKKREIVMGGVNFRREVLCCTHHAIRRIKAEGFKKLTIVLPNRFSPQNIEDDERREHLYQFVSIVTEAIIYANNPFEDFKADQDKKAKIEEVTFVFFGKEQQALDGFFKTAITHGESVGKNLVRTRRIMETPPNIKTPLSLASSIMGVEVGEEPADDWVKEKISSRITGYVLYGRDTLKAQGFGLIPAVNQGSDHEPCILKLHYRPYTRRQKRVRKVVLVGKGVVFDSGGYDLKLTDYYGNMHYDMVGAAIASAIPFLAEDFNLPVEIISITPLVQNMIGPKAILPGSIIRAYGGKTVEILNTDCEGRLILGEAIALGEKSKPDIMITVGSLGDTADFGPDFLKVAFVGDGNEKRIRSAERDSAEKVFILPRLEYLNKVDDAHQSVVADMVNDTPVFHTSPFVFLYNFFKEEPSWIFVDNAATFETDAQDFGTAPGFGVKYVWNLVQQFR
jgi:leucyl aminopeptidase